MTSKPQPQPTLPKRRIGIDLGGTKIAGVMLDARGNVMASERVATPQGNYPATLKAISDVVHMLESQTGATATVGIGTPGALSHVTHTIKNANSTCLNTQPLQQDLEQQLHRPVRIANDADCFALSEAIDGAGKDYATVFGVILGTGVGGGLVVNQQLLSGPNRITGEWGHNPLPWPTAEELPGRDCYCGKQGCIETWLSGPGLAAQTQVDDPKKLFDDYDHDEWAAPQIDQYCRRLAKALAHVINILDPHVIVLGGGLSTNAILYEKVPTYWHEWVFSDRVDTLLVPPDYGDASGVRGAAWLWSS